MKCEYDIPISNSCSSTALVNQGVPQGSVLGPILFVIYMLVQNICQHGLSFHSSADDTALSQHQSIHSLTPISPNLSRQGSHLHPGSRSPQPSSTFTCSKLSSISTTKSFSSSSDPFMPSLLSTHSDLLHLYTPSWNLLRHWPVFNSPRQTPYLQRQNLYCHSPNALECSACWSETPQTPFVHYSSQLFPLSHLSCFLSQFVWFLLSVCVVFILLCKASLNLVKGTI